MRYSQLCNILTLVNNFSIKHPIDVKYSIFDKSELTGEPDPSGVSQNPDSNWADFELNAGVYCLLTNRGEDVVYIGMSKAGLGDRVFKWLFTENNKAALMDEDAMLLIMSWSKEFSYMAPSLESYLIQHIPTLTNIAK